MLVAAPAAAAGVRSTISLPGGAEALATAAGLRHSPGAARVMLDVTRLIHDAPIGDAPGVDARRARLLAYLAAIPPDAPADEIPLPLTPDVWRAFVRRDIPDAQLALEILRDRSSALLYYGLFCLDDETLAWLADRRNVLETIHRDHAAVFAAFGRSLRVRGGRVATPGGPFFEPTWERLVGERARDVGSFIVKVLGRDRGRMAFFYDTVAHLDAPRQKFALGGRVADLYGVFARPEEEWRPSRRPFTRTAVDGALLFSSILVQADGRPAGPMWTALWEAVFQGSCTLEKDSSDRKLASVKFGASDRADAAWLASRIVAPGVGRARERLRSVLFAQRVFPSPDIGSAADLRDALCGVARAPALMLSLERIGAREPSLYARAAAVARRLPGVGQNDDRRARLVIIQAAAAVLVAAQQTRVFDPDRSAAVSLASDLVGAAEASIDKDDTGPVIDWIERTLVPALSKATGLDASQVPLDRILLSAAAGVRRDAGRAPVILWEDVRYRVDPPLGRLANAERIRSSQRSMSLDDALLLDRVAHGRTLAGDAERLAALKKAAAAAVAATDEDINGDFKWVARGPTRAEAEAMVGETLASIVYAISLGPATSAAARAANVASRHMLRAAASGMGPTAADTGWDLPAEEFGPTGWLVRGSLLGLDIGLARLSLRRVDIGLPSPPEVTDNDRRTLAETVRLMSAADLTDATRDAIAAAIARGRERAAELIALPDGTQTLGTEAGMDEMRRQIVAWNASRDPTLAASELWLSELLRLGHPQIAADHLDAWGTAMLPLEGGLTVRFPALGDGCLLAARPAAGIMAATLPDVTLRVVEALAELRLPASLAPDLLAYASQQVIDEAAVAHADDRDAIARAAREIAADRIVDFVAALSVEGPLIPEKSRPQMNAGKSQPQMNADKRR